MIGWLPGGEVQIDHILSNVAFSPRGVRVCAFLFFGNPDHTDLLEEQRPRVWEQLHAQDTDFAASESRGKIVNEANLD